MPVQRESKYRELALRAVELAEADNSHRDCSRLRCMDNIAIFFFLRCISQDLTGSGEDSNWAGTVRKAMRSVLEHPMRLYDVKSLGDLKFIGPALLDIIKSHLWSVYPPEPQTEEEAALEQQLAARRAIEQAEKRKQDAARRKANKAASKAMDAAAAAANAAGAANGLSAAVALPSPTGAARRQSGGAAAALPYSSGALATAASPPGEAAGEQPGGRKRKAPKKVYQPNLGTANYTFLIMLYRAHMVGEAFLTKKELMRRADASGLASRPGAIYGTQSAIAGPGRPQYSYDGWSGVSRMENNEPPLLQSYSNPKKCKLTIEGFEMAAQLHADAVTRGTVQPLPLDAVPPPQYASTAAPAAARGTAAIPASSPAAAAALSAGGPAPCQVAPPRKRSRAQPAQPPNSMAAAAAELDSLRDSHPWLNDNSGSGSGGGNRSGSGSADGSRVGRAAGGEYGTSAAASGGWDVLDGTMGSQGAMQASQDEKVAQLMEMGYSAGQANKALRASGNCVEAALDIIDISDSNDEEDLTGAGAGPAVPPPQPVSRARTMEPPRPAKPKEAGSSRPAAHPAAAAAPAAAEPAASDSASSDCEIIDCEEFLASAAPALAAPARVPGSQPSDGQQPRFQRRGDSHSVGSQDRQGVQDQPAPQHGAGRAGSAGSAGSDIAAAAAAAQRQPAPRLPPLPPRQQPAPSANAPGSSGAALAAGPASAAAAAAGCAAANAAGPTTVAAGAVPPGRSRSGVLSAGRPPLPPLVDPATGGIADATVRLPPLPQGARFSDVYDIVMLVDHREQFRHSAGGRAFAGRNEGLAHHVDQIRGRGVAAETAHLETGDATWIARPKSGVGETYVLDYLLERKAVDDLASSIKDGRYGKQKAKMRATGLRHLLYVLEGEPATLPSQTECQSIKTAAVETEVHSGFEVLHTLNIGHSITLFAQLTAALQAKYGPLRASDMAPGQQPLPTLAQLRAGAMQHGKQSVRDWWGLVLASVRGIGAETAEAVLRAYPTPRSLYDVWLRASRGATAAGGNPAAAPGRLLEGIEVFAGGTKITQAKSTKIIEALFGEEGSHRVAITC